MLTNTIKGKITTKITWCLTMIALLCEFAVVAEANQKAVKYDLAVKNVRVFDSKNKKVLENKTILISDKKIASIIDANQKFKAKNTIKGKGRLVIPGFIDTHTHILQTYGSRNFDRKYKLENEVLESYKKLIARQYLASGITTIIDMAQPEPWIERSIKLQKILLQSFRMFL